MVVKILYLILLLLALASCTPSVRFATSKAGTQAAHSDFNDDSTKNTQSKSTVQLRGYASYYSEKFQGNKTACGDIYNSKELTAAHRDIPCGTMVKVTNISNNKSVIVKINDRGPFDEGRIIDLSAAAAAGLDMLNDGVVEVELEVLNSEQ